MPTSGTTTLVCAISLSTNFSKPSLGSFDGEKEARERRSIEFESSGDSRRESEEEMIGVC
jgi:hypothetical protein